MLQHRLATSWAVVMCWSWCCRLQCLGLLFPQLTHSCGLLEQASLCSSRRSSITVRKDSRQRGLAFSMLNCLLTGAAACHARFSWWLRCWRPISHGCFRHL